MKILVLVAHPDDEVIMCGGTIDKLVNKGHEVYVTFFTRNDQAYFGRETQVQRKSRAVNEAKKSSKYLGFHLQQLSFSDMNLGKDEGKLIRAVIAEIRRVEPDVIVSQHPDDRHIDHSMLGQIVPEANFQSGNELCGGTKTWSAPLVLQGEVNLEMTMLFDFQVVSELSSDNIRHKTEAFQIYESVMREHGTDVIWLHKKLTMHAELRGRAAGLMHGEAFVINTYAPLTDKALLLASKVMER